jgi:hypothetical protein
VRKISRRSVGKGKTSKEFGHVVAECVVATSGNSKSWTEPDEFTEQLELISTDKRGVYRPHNKVAKREAKILSAAGRFAFANNRELFTADPAAFSVVIALPVAVKGKKKKK